MHIMGLQKMTLLDYPGKVACTVFFGGCNFRCPYCHNAGLVLGNDSEPVIEEKEFFSFLSHRQGLLDGVCITGGEPMVQKDLETFIIHIRDLGFQVKLDTNGSFPKQLKSLLDNHLLDYISMDIKNSREHYGATIGIQDYDTKPIEQSVSLLMNQTIPYEFRTTVVKEYHTLEDIKKIGSWLAGCRAYYLQAFKDSGNLIGEGVMTAFEKSSMEEMIELLRPEIPAVSLRGI
ncbi:anaerobic ribonucleoside-triphosphate reductase activating protein [uncultured Sphaerochaeta sp.]|uniref:anaerobic ribonucleoside-triphosphate reductase activating protein n=1 Tax=uncultured Sphaerochaeta sp. TaxID=886478 RepID=UPI002A0A3960|nr:anaerobic ribonucleoside-triphosphate reductase activating protein [uncultured Sphaerochaeta sp.]